MTREEIGAILKEIRLASGKTQKEVAELLGRKQQIVGHWETGYSQPDANTLFALCDIYGTTVDKAFGFKKKDIAISKRGMEIIKMYNGLDNHGKDMVDTVLEKEYDRCKLEKKNNIVELTAHDKSYLEPVAAHERTDIEVTNDMVKHDDDIMDDPNF